MAIIQQELLKPPAAHSTPYYAPSDNTDHGGTHVVVVFYLHPYIVT